MNKIEIDVLSKNNTKNKYIEIISNYRLANENNQKKIELLEAKVEELISDVPPPFYAETHAGATLLLGEQRAQG
jgi:hypothetical protein